MRAAGMRLKAASVNIWTQCPQNNDRNNLTAHQTDSNQALISTTYACLRLWHAPCHLVTAVVLMPRAGQVALADL